MFKVITYPSGDFTIGTIVPPRADRKDACASTFTQRRELDGDHVVEWIAIRTDRAAIDRARNPLAPVPTDEQWASLFDAYERSGQHQKAVKLVEKLSVKGGVCSSSPMGLSTATNSHKPPSSLNNLAKPRSRRGSRGITPRGKRLVRSAATLLERDCKKQNLSLVTVTLPALSPEQLETVCLSWSEITRRFLQEVGRMLKRNKLPSEYLAVTEIQEKRYEKWNQFCPHLHLLIQGRRTRYQPWAITPSALAELWRRVLSQFVEGPLDCSAATRIEKPRKSLSRELGKYMSKGAKVLKLAKKRGHDHLIPSSWYRISAGLKRSISKEIRRFSGDAALTLIRNLKILSEQGALSYVEIYVQIDGQDKRVGWVGRFSSIEVYQKYIQDTSLSKFYLNKQVNVNQIVCA